MKKKNFALVDVIVKEDTPTIEIVPLTKRDFRLRLATHNLLQKKRLVEFMSMIK
jgi:hypothetical protein